MMFHLPLQLPPFLLHLLLFMYQSANGLMEETNHWILKTSIFHWSSRIFRRRGNAKVQGAQCRGWVLHRDWSIIFDRACQIENLNLTRDIPPKPWVYLLRKALDDVIWDGKRSSLHPGFKDEPLLL
ncbi:hypothetical protein EV702DRAFT_1044794 [Suillus placidus]|uniref:Uncharacterized protein n=1 Tax=Suillus placidus TaxID=48579 RepID=A0A9P7D3U0_9AGAM|nr:hypothetical protein EV702DRAFT_1044794 [Suillus placidus]